MKNTGTVNIMKLLIYTVILGTAASVCHSIYNFTGEKFIVGLFTPVNESVWEHQKLMFFPFLVWWIIMYFRKKEAWEMSMNTWIVSSGVSLVIAPVSVVLLHYGYTSGWGRESVFFDIALVFVCYFIALCVAFHFMKHSKPNKLAAILCSIIIVGIGITFIIFTGNPPQLPIFEATVKTAIRIFFNQL